MRRYPKNGGQFAVIWTDLLYEDSVPDSAKLLYGEIFRLSDAEGWCDASNKDFMELLGCSETTVRNLLKSLVAVNQISIEYLPQTEGQGGTCRRIFCGRKLAFTGGGVPAEICGGTRRNLRGVPAENCGGSQYKRKNNPPISPEARMRFDLFWQAYPRKEAKKDALRAWGKLDPDDKLLGTILAALKVQAKSEQWTRQGVRYIPYPATWLNGERWADEVKAAVSDNGPAEDEEGFDGI